jgi:hypothetical protein
VITLEQARANARLVTADQIKAMIDRDLFDIDQAITSASKKGRTQVEIARPIILDEALFLIAFPGFKISFSWDQTKGDTARVIWTEG